MKVSLNWIKKYIDLPKDLTSKQIAYDLTLRTVEVESVENTAEKYNNIVVGKILEVKPHPNADKLRVCMVDIGENEPKQIVCGGSNLYEGEFVVVSKPGALVVWHGEGEPVEIKETKMRGESSFGMICGAEEVYLDSLVELENVCFSIPWSKNLFKNDITNPNAFYILAINNGKVIAYCGLYNVLDEADITNIAVIPEYRKKGLASKILDMIFEYCQNRKIAKITLEVRKSNESALNLYKNKGFTIVGERKKYYSDNGETAILMTKQIEEVK